ncbi:MAG: TCP-1/cpn60 chaperonin family protein [Candidatus Pacearchaeota archaeon]|nr:TCP-1/cpn60 chaperonin family protein [Candidatus Pacearchaeota archaeon]
MNEKQPVYILPENVSRTLGRDAQRNNILAAKVVADIVKTTLGPKGMDKMLVDSTGNIIVTNDGVTILEEMEIEHPAAKMMVEVAKTQESEVGDGTTTAAVLGGKLLENAEKLLDRKIHPTIIVKGYKMAEEKALEILNEVAILLDNKKILKQIAMTAMTGKGAEEHRDKLSDLIIGAVDAIATGKEINIDAIKIQKIKGDGIKESELIQGIVIDKERANNAMPSLVKEAKILLTDVALEIRNPETEAKISVSTPEQLESFILSEEKYLKDMTDRIIASGANVVFCQKGIDDVAQYYLAKAGIFAVRRVPRSDMEKIASATSGKIISNLREISIEDFGYAEVVEEVKKGGETLTYIKGCKNPKAVSIIIRGGTSHVLDEIERAIKDGLGDVVSAINSGKVVPGGGAIEIEIAKRLRAYAKTVGGREQLAIEEFANSLESIPEALAENAGLDPIDSLAELRKRHEAGKINEGLNLYGGNAIEDSFAAGIIEPLKVKKQAISSASEFATMILRIDDVLVSRGAGKSRMPMPNPYEGMD